MRMQLVGMFVAISAVALAAQAPVDPMATVAPYVDERVAAILRVDLNRVDTSALAKRWATVVGAGESRDDLQSPLFDQVGQLKAAGATTIYAVMYVDDVRPMILVSQKAGSDSAKLQALVKSIVGYQEVTAEQRGNILVLAAPATWKRLKSVQPVARPDLAAALAEGKDADVCLALGVGSDVRRAVEETMPNFPESAGGGPVTALTRGMKWVSCQLKTSPKLEAQIVVQSSDADGAKQLANLWQAWVKSMTQPPPNESIIHALLHASTNMAAAQVAGDRLVVRLDAATMERNLPVLARRVQLADQRTRSLSNLRQLALALHSYHDDHKGKFPTDIYAKNGKPLLSWRAQLLPYVEGGNLANGIRMDEPWDSEHNKQFLSKIPKQFVAPGQKSPAGSTTYLGTIGEKFMFAPQPNGPARGIRDMVDGTSQTIMLVETADEMAVPWTKPGDLSPTEKDPMKGLIGHYSDGFYIAFGDGSSRFIRKGIDPKDLYAMFTINGNETIKEFERR